MTNLESIRKIKNKIRNKVYCMLLGGDVYFDEYENTPVEDLYLLMHSRQEQRMKVLENKVSVLSKSLEELKETNSIKED